MEDAGNATFWMMLLDQLVLPLVVLIITPLVAALVNRLVLLLQKKWDVEISEKKREQIDQIVREAIDFAEEQAHKALKGKDTDVEKALEGDKKMEIALDYMKRRGEQLGVDEIIADKSEVLARRVESMLFDDRRKEK